MLKKKKSIVHLECCKLFGIHHDLKKHGAKHKVRKPFQYDDCGEALGRAYILKKH